MIKKEYREKWNKSGLVTKEDREQFKCKNNEIPEAEWRKYKGEIPENTPVNIDAETMDRWFGHKQLRC
jgi:hypothetical protein